MKHHFKPALLIPVLIFHATAWASDDIPLLRPEERNAVEAQTDRFNRALMPALADAAHSTVRVWSGDRRLAYGTVIGDGQTMLTKWSEVAAVADNLRIEGSSGEVLAATISGVYEDEDIAVLQTTGTPLAPIRWWMETPPLGGFLAAPQPDGRPAAFGVVSVLERNLRDTDSAFLGVVGALDFVGPGVKIEDLAEGSGAAAAGLKPGEIILQVDERAISGLMELRNSLVGRSPGESVIVRLADGNREREVEVRLGNRPELPRYPGDRLRQMERMGGPISRVRDSFTSAIQTDMRTRPDQIGGPVVDLKGRVIGITMARADRTRSFVMPAAAIERMLQTETRDPLLAEVRGGGREPSMRVGRMDAPRGRMPQPGSEERLRRHLSEMRQLMDFMHEEMNSLEQGR